MNDRESIDVRDPEQPARHRRRKRRSRLPLARFTIATVCVAIWAASFTRSIFDQSFEPPSGLEPVALAAATYLFGSGLINQKKNADEEDEEDD